MVSKVAALPDASAVKVSGAGRLDDGTIEELVKVFKLLSDQTRLRILLYLARAQELHVAALCEALDQSQPGVSHHLGLLREAGLVAVRREGKHNYYRIRPRRFQNVLELLFAAMPAKKRWASFEECLLALSAGQTLTSRPGMRQ
ncbi:MAG: metalloregulator ArsR/SmtB family transcription factor [Pirellulales bacterium]|nr:metalloregulator ArsR/SmtB family transcription factor [Pirellulales bacterium]